MHGRLQSFRSRALLACVPVFGLVMMASVGTAAAAHSPAKAHHKTTASEAKAALEHLLLGRHGTNHAIGHASPGISLKKVKSGNWSGYADDNSKGTKYSKVTGSWTEPKATCTSAQSLAVFWVGIDGFSSQTVEQDGTLIFCNGGSPTYFTWWEMFPSNAIKVVGSTVKPGDKIAASVVKTGTKYALKVTDSTTSGNSFSTTRTCAAATCVDTSAEWIAEAPSGSSGVLPLTKFGTWTLAGATVKAGSKSGTIKTFPNQKITMENSSGQVKAQTGALNSAGNQFKVTWKRST
jgi:Peptidase A4 family